MADNAIEAERTFISYRSNAETQKMERMQLESAVEVNKAALAIESKRMEDAALEVEAARRTREYSELRRDNANAALTEWDTEGRELTSMNAALSWASNGRQRPGDPLHRRALPRRTSRLRGRRSRTSSTRSERSASGSTGSCSATGWSGRPRRLPPRSDCRRCASNRHRCGFEVQALNVADAGAARPGGRRGARLRQRAHVRRGPLVPARRRSCRISRGDYLDMPRSMRRW